jgi:hypothetical protein
MRVLAPTAWAGDLAEWLATVRSRVSEPFDAVRVELLTSLSQRILQHPRLRRDPGGAALGFWLRRAHLAKLKEDFAARGREDIRVAAGLVFHIAPANVDTMFVFSWALSFLAGNTDILRLTTRSSPIMEDLIECLEGLLRGSSVPETTLFVTYEHDDEITTRLSLACDTRIVWGGDETVRRMRALPLSPHATERAFASKRSLSVFVASSYIGATELQKTDAAGKMAADLAPFGQMACSSPHVLYWVGDPEAARVCAADFASRLEAAMAERLGEPDLGWASRRINFAFSRAAEGSIVAMLHQPNTTLVTAQPLDSADLREPCGAGLLTQVEGVTLAAVTASLAKEHQTITYFGLEPDQRLVFARAAGAAGVDRIVPVGSALDFGPQWDGHDLWSDLTRVVVVQ